MECDRMERVYRTSVGNKGSNPDSFGCNLVVLVFSFFSGK